MEVLERRAGIVNNGGDCFGDMPIDGLRTRPPGNGGTPPSLFAIFVDIQIYPQQAEVLETRHRFGDGDGVLSIQNRQWPEIASI